MERRVEVSPLASLQIDRILERIAEESPERAAKWQRRLFETIRSLRKLPTSRPVAPEETEKFGVEIREFVYGKRRGIFRILYAVRADAIRIVSVRHASRHPDRP